MKNRSHIQSMRFLTAVLLVLLGGCKWPSDQGQSSWEPADSGVVAQLFSQYGSRWNGTSEFKCGSQAKGKDAFGCLRQSCMDAGGLFQGDTKFCACPSGLGFAASYGRCLPPIPDNHPLAHSENHIKIRFVEPNGQITEPSLSHLLESRLKTTHNLNFPLLTHFGYTLNVVNRDAVTKALLLQNLRADPTFDDRLSYRSANTPLEQTELAYDLPEEEVFEPLNSAATSATMDFSIRPQDSRLTNIFNDLRLWESQKLALDTHILSGSANGCIYLSSVDKVVNSATFQGSRFVIDHTVYVDGLVYSHTLSWSLTEDGRSPIAIVKIDKSGKANLIYLLSTDNDGGHVALNAAVFDRYGRSVMAHLNVLSLPMLRSDLRHTPDRGTVAVCEYGVTPTNKELSERLVGGPFASQGQNLSGSVWGWNKNQSGSLAEFFEGAWPVGRIGYVPESTAQVLAEHNGDVISSVLQKSKTVSVSNLSLDQCFSSNPEVNPLLRIDYPGVAVNLSAGNFDGGDECEATIEAISKTTTTKLWLVAAGNDQTISSCDKRIRYLPNVVSVGAMDSNAENQLADYSTGKEKNLQIAVAMKGSVHEGTSFAAPVASAVIADLALQYPNLTPAQLKRSLILGTDFLALDLVSGGRLNRELAFKIAAELAKDAEASNESLLDQIYGLANLKSQIDQVRKGLSDSNISDDDRSRLSEKSKDLKQRYSLRKRVFASHLNWLKNHGV